MSPNLRMKAWWLAGLLAVSACLVKPAAAGSLLFCEQSSQQSVARKSDLLLFSQQVRQLLDESGHQAAIISRSGLDLERFHIRLSHAGISLRNNPNSPWSVRQLYYACDEQRPHLYDQGLPGFLIDQPQGSNVYLSILLLPAKQEDQLVQAALDNKLSLQLLGADYSANAYPFSTRYQNCNQWLVELLAHAWGQLPRAGDGRKQAQDWLQQQRYRPDTIDVKHRYMVWATNVVPLVHNGDHPDSELAENHYLLSLPTAIEGFVRQQAEGTERIQVCLRGKTLITHRGWDDMADDCSAAAGDTVQQLD
ncbi:DUF2145 domain-containing protein [Aquitalea sp.]|uniref:DUF2145 domain-containing protein n=1 Tax=Aquitalea sp. TaxID=1872623 RepID=UPI00258BBE66|nr:DUF2145 domain-containing protein [Aquitalea sp.]